MKFEIKSALIKIGNGARLIKSAGNKYAVDKKGRIWSVTNAGSFRSDPLRRSTYLSKKGYECVTLVLRDGKRHTKLVHRIVAECFCELDLTDKSVSVHHKNAKRADNRVQNLQVVSRGDNTRMAAAGRKRRNTKFYSELASHDSIKLPVMQTVWSES
jgi:hypothetical protein